MAARSSSAQLEVFRFFKFSIVALLWAAAYGAEAPFRLAARAGLTLAAPREGRWLWLLQNAVLLHTQRNRVSAVTGRLNESGGRALSRVRRKRVRDWHRAAGGLRAARRSEPGAAWRACSGVSPHASRHGGPEH